MKATRAKWFTSPTDMTPAALALWKAHAGALFRDGILREDTASRVKDLFELRAVAQAAALAIQEKGITISSSSGAQKQNPAINALLRAQDAADALMRSLENDRLAVRLGAMR